jgi:retron-type reverse transcriptase
MPIFEKTLIHDTYANRVGYGTHRALERFTSFARSSHYVLQCDIRKYFPSIDREILKTLIRRKIQCPDTLWLIDAIIDNGNDQEGIPDYFPNDDLLTPVERKRGLPIGNLTSQWFANIYLSGFDHFVKEQLKIKQYLRYVDDFALFADDRYFLQEAQMAIVEYLNSLRLKLHPIKTQITATRIGVNFVGFRILPNRIKIRTANLRRARVRLKKQKKELEQGKIDLIAFKKSLQSWQAHLKHGDTYRLRQDIFESLGVTP